MANAGYRAASLQGNLSQSQRQDALDGFRSGPYQILVATDIAARGIDVSSISHVINFDMPDTVDDYTHRIGRTGRAAKTGDAFTFIDPEDEEMVRGIERVLGYRDRAPHAGGLRLQEAYTDPDSEFAHPPREPQRRRSRRFADPSGSRPGLPPLRIQNKFGGGREGKRKFGLREAQRPKARSSFRRGTFSHSS